MAYSTSPVLTCLFPGRFQGPLFLKSFMLGAAGGLRNTSAESFLKLKLREGPWMVVDTSWLAWSPGSINWVSAISLVPPGQGEVWGSWRWSPAGCSCRA